MTANAGQRKPTAANDSQRRPTQVNEGQCRPIKSHSSQRRPTKANRVCFFHFLFFILITTRQCPPHPLLANTSRGWVYSPPPTIHHHIGKLHCIDSFVI